MAVDSKNVFWHQMSCNAKYQAEDSVSSDSADAIIVDARSASRNLEP